MDNIITLKPKVSKETIHLWNLSKDIDNLVILSLQNGLDPLEIAGVLANRLKEVCNSASISSNKDVLAILKDSILK